MRHKYIISFTAAQTVVFIHKLTCPGMGRQVQSTVALYRCQGTPVWAEAHREVCFCLKMVSSRRGLPGGGTEPGPAVWPFSPVAHPQTRPALDPVLSYRTIPPIW